MTDEAPQLPRDTVDFAYNSDEMSAAALVGVVSNPAVAFGELEYFISLLARAAPQPFAVLVPQTELATWVEFVTCNLSAGLTQLFAGASESDWNPLLLTMSTAE